MRLAALLCLLTFAAAAPAAADTLELKNGDKITGEVLERDDERVVLQHATLGRLEIPVSELTPPKPDKPGLFGTRFLAGWSRSVGAGLSGSEGQSKNFDFTAELDLDFENEERRQAIDAAYYYASQEKSKSNNQFFAAYNHDFRFPGSPLFAFANGRYDADEFKSWDHRLAASGGIGLEIVQRETFSLRSRTGLGVSQTFGGGDTRTSPEGVIGLETKWKIAPGQSFSASTTYYPDLARLPEFRQLSDVGWTIAVGTIEGLGIKLGVTHEYESQAEGDNNNLKYKGNLIYAF